MLFFVVFSILVCYVLIFFVPLEVLQVKWPVFWVLSHSVLSRIIRNRVSSKVSNVLRDRAVSEVLSDRVLFRTLSGCLYGVGHLTWIVSHALTMSHNVSYSHTAKFYNMSWTVSRNNYKNSAILN